MALQHLRSATANKRPTPVSMSDGQAAMNTNLASPGLFFKDSNGDLVKVGPVHVGTTAPNVSPAVGGQTGNSKGEQWLDTSGTNPVLKIWDGSAWQSQAGEFVNASGDTMTGALGVPLGSAALPSVYPGTDTNTGLYSPGADQIALGTNGQQRLAVNSSGVVLVGPGTARAVGGATVGTLVVETLALGMSCVRNSADTSGAIIALGKSRAAAANGVTAVQNGDILGEIRFAGANGTDLTSIGAHIRATVDGEVGTLGDTTDMPTSLAFSTTPDGAASATERLGISSAGLATFTPTPNSEAIRVGGTGGISAINGGYVTLTSNAKSFGNAADFQNILANSTTGLGVISPMRSPGNATVGGVWVAPGNATAGTTYAWSSMTPALTWDTSGQVGIGTLSPESLLDLGDGTTGRAISWHQSSTVGHGHIWSQYSAATLWMARGFKGSTTANAYESSVSSSIARSGVQCGNGSVTLYTDAAATIAYGSAYTPSPRLHVDSSGNVGIGTTSPAVPLEVNGNMQTSPGSGGGLVLHESDITRRNRIQLTADSDGAVINSTFTAAGSTSILFKGGGIERARIDSSGRLLVGASTSVLTGTATAAALQISSPVGLAVRRNENIASPASIVLGKSRNAADGSFTILQNNDDIGELRFAGDDGADLQSLAAKILCQVDGTPGLDDMPGRLVFSTTADGASIPTERMRIDSAGRVGIGTDSLNEAMHLYRGAGTSTYLSLVGNANVSAPLLIGQDSTGLSRIWQSGANPITFWTNSLERARIDSSGRLLVGTSASVDFGSQIQTAQTGGNGALEAFQYSNDAAYPYITVAKSRGASIGTNAIVLNNDILGAFFFRAANGTAYNTAASIVGYVDGTPGANDMPGRIVFATTSDGAAAPTEACRITSDKYLRFAASTGGVQFNGDTAAANALDDYEEGTFTPTIVGSTLAGTGTYTSQVGRYTKIGNRVCFSIQMAWSAHTGTGNMSVAGLPVAVTTQTSAGSQTAAITSTNLTTPAGTYLTNLLPANNTVITLYSMATGGGALAALAMDTAATVYISGVYEAA